MSFMWRKSLACVSLAIFPMDVGVLLKLGNCNHLRKITIWVVGVVIFVGERSGFMGNQLCLNWWSSIIDTLVAILLHSIIHWPKWYHCLLSWLPTFSISGTKTSMCSLIIIFCFQINWQDLMFLSLRSVWIRCHKSSEYCGQQILGIAAWKSLDENAYGLWFQGVWLMNFSCLSRR